MAVDKKRMGDLHEKYLAELTGSRQSKASGAKFDDKADGRGNHLLDEWAVCFDGKSTRGLGINITREMLAKIIDEAHGERPMIGLRFYDNDRLDRIGFDWVAIEAQHFAELLFAARHAATSDVVTSEQGDRVRELEDQLTRALQERDEALQAEQLTGPRDARLDEVTRALGVKEEENATLRGRMQNLVDAMDERDVQVRELTAQLQAREAIIAQQPRQPSPAPEDPRQTGLIVSGVHDGQGGIRWRGQRMRYRQPPQDFAVESVRIENTAHGHRALFVNDQQVREGTLLLDGNVEFVAKPHDQACAEAGPHEGSMADA